METNNSLTNTPLGAYSKMLQYRHHFNIDTISMAQDSKVIVCMHYTKLLLNILDLLVIEVMNQDKTAQLKQIGYFYTKIIITSW